MVAEHFGVAPEHCMVFEDIPNGMRATISAGMKVCGVEDEFSTEQNPLKKNFLIITLLPMRKF